MAATGEPARGYPQRVETERLLLREFHDSDIEVYARMLADPEVVRYLLPGGPIDRHEAWRHMAMLAGHWLLKGFGHWAVEVKETGRFIGRAGLWFPDGWPEYEIGWTIDPMMWGNGYATEAGRAALHHARYSLGVPHVISLILPENARSIRVSEKLGGRLDKREILQGRETLFYRYW